MRFSYKHTFLGPLCVSLLYVVIKRAVAGIEKFPQILPSDRVERAFPPSFLKDLQVASLLSDVFRALSFSFSTEIDNFSKTFTSYNHFISMIRCRGNTETLSSSWHCWIIYTLNVPDLQREIIETLRIENIAKLLMLRLWKRVFSTNAEGILLNVLKWKELVYVIGVEVDKELNPLVSIGPCPFQHWSETRTFTSFPLDFIFDFSILAMNILFLCYFTFFLVIHNKTFYLRTHFFNYYLKGNY